MVPVDTEVQRGSLDKEIMALTADIAALEESDEEEPVATALDGQILIQPTSLVFDDYLSVPVPAEDAVWDATMFESTCFGVGCAVVLRESKIFRSVFGELGCRKRKAVVNVRAMLDIEDLRNSARSCCTSPKQASTFPWPAALGAADSGCGRSADETGHGCHREGRGRTSGGDRRDLFPKCDLCNREGLARERRPCAACDLGMKVITKNTFLVMTDDIVSVSEEKIVPSIERRSKSF